MKKILAFILLITYAFASSGASVDLHYCMGKLIGLDFDYSSKRQCGNCKMPVKDTKGCCNNKQFKAKIDTDQQVTQNNISLNNDFTATTHEYSVLNNILYNSTTIVHPLIHGPPLISYTPLYLFDCSFRI